MTDTVAPVWALASLTFAKMGMPSKSSPAFFGFTPATKQFLPFAYSRHMRVWNWPVLPVMPWVMTLVSWLMRMLMISLAARPSSPRRRPGPNLRSQIPIEVLPIGIHRLNQIHFPVSMPALDRLLTSDRFNDGIVIFV